MADEFYCGACGKWKPLSERVDRPGKRPKCLGCEQRARKLDATEAAAKPTGALRRPAAKLGAAYLDWVSRV